MKKMVIANIGIIFLSANFLFACAAGKKQYDIGMQLSRAGKHSEAIAYRTLNDYEMQHNAVPPGGIYETIKF